MSVWVKEEMLQHWNKTIICLLHKNGDCLGCSNYRDISLITSAYKVLSNILLSSLLPYSEKEIGKYECGFRKGRSTVDQIFTLRMILEKGLE